MFSINSFHPILLSKNPIFSLQVLVKNIPILHSVFQNMYQIKDKVITIKRLLVLIIIKLASICCISHRVVE